MTDDAYRARLLNRAGRVLCGSGATDYFIESVVELIIAERRGAVAEERAHVVKWLRHRSENGPPSPRERLALMEAAEILERCLDRENS